MFFPTKKELNILDLNNIKSYLKRKKPKNVKLLYQHKSDMPIGVFDEIKEDLVALREKMSHLRRFL